MRRDLADPEHQPVLGRLWHLAGPEDPAGQPHRFDLAAPVDRLHPLHPADPALLLPPVEQAEPIHYPQPSAIGPQ